MAITLGMLFGGESDFTHHINEMLPGTADKLIQNYIKPYIVECRPAYLKPSSTIKLEKPLN